jgi:hypothetical protein
LCDYLKLFGVSVFGSTYLYNLDGTKTETQVHCITLPLDFPIQNFQIVEQLYGFDETLINICLSGANEMRGYGFTFNTEDKSCTLERFTLGSTIGSKKYSSFSEMMNEINSVKEIDEISLN